MNPPTPVGRRLSLRRKLAYSALALSIAAVAVYAAFLVVRAGSLYREVAGAQRGWRGTVHRADAQLGFAPIPGARGAELFAQGPPLEMRFDRDGFRASVKAGDGSRRKPLLLALGGSFTYGAASEFEDAYPHQLAERLGGSALNAGVASYGLTQMLLRGRELIPRIEPDIVVVQYSPWLVDRAIQPFAPVYHSVLPVPYLIDAADGGLDIAPPVFPAAVLRYDMSRYRASDGEDGGAGGLAFAWRVGLPLLLHDDRQRLAYELERWIGAVPAPTTNRERVVATVYQELSQLCRRPACVLVIAVLGKSAAPMPLPAALQSIDAVVVDTHRALVDRLSEPTDSAYAWAYTHFAGDPPVMIDRHPNPRAHAIIAEAIYVALRPPRGALELEHRLDHLVLPVANELGEEGQSHEAIARVLGDGTLPGRST